MKHFSPTILLLMICHTIKIECRVVQDKHKIFKLAQNFLKIKQLNEIFPDESKQVVDFDSPPPSHGTNAAVSNIIKVVLGPSSFGSTLSHKTQEVGYGERGNLEVCFVNFKKSSLFKHELFGNSLSHRDIQAYSCRGNVYEGVKVSQEVHADPSGHPLDQIRVLYEVISERGWQHKMDVADTLFKNFIKKFEKVYATEVEMSKRFAIFQVNLAKVLFLQATELGNAVYKVNEFSDLSYGEFVNTKLGLKTSLSLKSNSHDSNSSEHRLSNKLLNISETKPLPVNFDWRKHGAVTEVKNQGSCGSCWAFSTTGNIEGVSYIKRSQEESAPSQLISLSEQELVDCDKEDHGCEGGLPMNAYDAVVKLGGLETERDYAYEGEEERCNFNREKVRVQIKGGTQLEANETKIAQAVNQVGPISIGLNANAMQFYFGGVSHPLSFLCSPEKLDHGVLLVGFGYRETRFLHTPQPFWIIKNSWGVRWGEQGYYRLYRGGGVCGVDQMASSAII